MPTSKMTRVEERPYFKHKIAELESIVRACREDPDQLRTIRAELERRSTTQAHVLLEKVEAHLRSRSGFPPAVGAPKKLHEAATGIPLTQPIAGNAMPLADRDSAAIRSGERPHFKHSIAELGAMVRACGQAPDRLRAIAAELRKRSTPQAQAMLLKVEAQLRVLTNPLSSAGTPNRREGGVAADGRGVQPVIGVNESPTATVSADILIRYTVLRKLISREAEILACWGVTPTLPTELLSVVVAAWRQRLKTSPDPDPTGRTISRLDADLVALEQERAIREHTASSAHHPKLAPRSS